MNPESTLNASAHSGSTHVTKPAPTRKEVKLASAQGTSRPASEAVPGKAPSNIRATSASTSSRRLELELSELRRKIQDTSVTPHGRDRPITNEEVSQFDQSHVPKYESTQERSIKVIQAKIIKRKERIIMQKVSLELSKGALTYEMRKLDAQDKCVQTWIAAEKGGRQRCKSYIRDLKYLTKALEASNVNAKGKTNQ